MNYESEKAVASTAAPGVTFTIARISLGRRIELIRRMWELVGRAEYAQAGQNEAEKLEATLLSGEIDKTYLSWGLLRVAGLILDGQDATPESLVAAGPEELCREIVAAIKRECGLTEAERKTEDRLPFPVLESSRVEVRRVQEEPVGASQTMRTAAG